MKKKKKQHATLSNYVQSNSYCGVSISFFLVRFCFNECYRWEWGPCLEHVVKLGAQIQLLLSARYGVFTHLPLFCSCSCRTRVYFHAKRHAWKKDLCVLVFLLFYNDFNYIPPFSYKVRFGTSTSPTGVYALCTFSRKQVTTTNCSAWTWTPI